MKSLPPTPLISPCMQPVCVNAPGEQSEQMCLIAGQHRKLKGTLLDKGLVFDAIVDDSGKTLRLYFEGKKHGQDPLYTTSTSKKDATNDANEATRANFQEDKKASRQWRSKLNPILEQQESVGFTLPDPSLLTPLSEGDFHLNSASTSANSSVNTSPVTTRRSSLSSALGIPPPSEELIKMLSMIRPLREQFLPNENSCLTTKEDVISCMQRITQKMAEHEARSQQQSLSIIPQLLNENADRKRKYEELLEENDQLRKRQLT